LTSFFHLTPHAPPSSPLFPYTTLFRSKIIRHLFLEKTFALDPVRMTTHRQRPSAYMRQHYFRHAPEVIDHVSLRNLRLWKKDFIDRKSTRLNSSHVSISYAVFCLKKKK